MSSAGERSVEVPAQKFSHQARQLLAVPGEGRLVKDMNDAGVDSPFKETTARTDMSGRQSGKSENHGLDDKASTKMDPDRSASGTSFASCEELGVSSPSPGEGTKSVAFPVAETTQLETTGVAVAGWCFSEIFLHFPTAFGKIRVTHKIEFRTCIFCVDGPSTSEVNETKCPKSGVPRDSSFSIPKLPLNLVRRSTSQHSQRSQRSQRDGVLWPGTIMELPPWPAPPEGHPLITPRTGAAAMPRKAACLKYFIQKNQKIPAPCGRAVHQLDPRKSFQCVRPAQQAASRADTVFCDPFSKQSLARGVSFPIFPRKAHLFQVQFNRATWNKHCY